MKIAQVIGSCAPGGAEVFVKDLIKQLKFLGHDVELWVMIRAKDKSLVNEQTLDFEKSFVSELNRYDIPVKFLNKRLHKDWIKTTRNLKKQYYRFKPQIVHSHLESVTFHVVKALSSKTNIVQTIHSSVIHYPFLQKMYLQKSISSYVAISNKVRSILINSLNLKPKKIATIYNGIDLNKFKINRKNNSEVKKIISIGRLTKAKDYPNLFKALDILIPKLNNQNIPLPSVDIVGTGEIEQELKALTKKMNLDNIVSFLGVRQDIPELLKESDIYIMSSEWEGLSISLIEALASGIPIVATNAGSNNEVIENNVSGIIVPIKNPEALAEGIYNLIIDKDLRERLSKEAVKRSELFSIENCAKKHVEMYKELISYSR